MKLWYYAKDDEQHGPIAKEQLMEMVRTGMIGSSDLIWTQGMDDWSQADQVTGLFSPPPLSSLGQPEHISARSENIDSRSIITSYKIELPSVHKAGVWAKWFGIIKILLGIAIVFMMISQVGDNFNQFDISDGFAQIIIGCISFLMGKSILNKNRIKRKNFTIIIWIYSIALILHIVNFVILASEGEKPSGQIVPILTAWAVWIFVKGRKEYDYNPESP